MILSEYSLGLAPTALYENNTALGHRSLNSRHNTHTGASRESEGAAPQLGSSGEDRAEEEEAPRRRVSVSEMGLGLPSPILIARGTGKVRSLKVGALPLRPHD